MLFGLLPLLFSLNKMSSRRLFLQQTSIAAVAALLSPSHISSALAGNTKTAAVNNIGLQLFTLRDLLNKDVKSVISKVAQIGYNQVETYYGYPGAYTSKGFWGLDAKEFRSLLKDNNLTSPSGHYNTTAFLEKDGTDDVLKRQIETAATVGQKYYVIPALPTAIRKEGTLDDYKAMAAKFNIAAEHCKSHKLKLAYHNHNFEFKDQGNGITGYQILLNETDPMIKFELDIFWAINAGLDPLQMFKKYPGRFTMWHVKDMDKNDKDIYTEVGTGRIDYKTILQSVKATNVEYLFVEQDVVKIDPYESITQSINYVKSILSK